MLYKKEKIILDKINKGVNIKMQNNLNKSIISKYTFENFVVVKNNEFAFNVAEDIAENKTNYNLLFIYGGNGVGKTHLCCAILNKILENNKNLNVLYNTADQFTVELINAIKENTMKQFREKYRSVDALAIDNIQYIAGKERIQEEFFNTFHDLYFNNKKIILSSDKAPKDINLLENRIEARINWGIVAKISDYNFEERLEILKNKAKMKNLEINEETLSMIAKLVNSNIMELEGVLNTVIEYSKIFNKSIDKKMVQEVLEDRGIKKKRGI